MFIVGTCVVAFYSTSWGAGESLDAYAKEIIQKCAIEPHRPSCYEKEVPKLMGQGFSMEEAFGVMKIIQQEDVSYIYCHTLGHYLSAKETAKDPSRWKEVVTRVPHGICSYGGIHGAFQERFKKDSMPEATAQEVINLLGDICGTGFGTFTQKEYAMCVHAIGHLAMYITNANLKTSIMACESLGLAKNGVDHSRGCFDGAFMQIFQPLEPEDFALVKGKVPQTISERDSLCNTFTGVARTSCWRESWPLEKDMVKSGAGVLSFCNTVGDGVIFEKEYCMDAILYLVTALEQFQEEKFIAFCKELPTIWTKRCFAKGTPYFLEAYWLDFSKPLYICEQALGAEARKECLDSLVEWSTITFNPKSTEAYALCQALPTEWKIRCFERQQEYSDK